MKNFRFILYILCIVLIGSITATSCTPTSTEVKNYSLPYVFEDIMQAGVQGAPPVEVILDTKLPTAPTEIAVYKVITPNVDDEYASALAQQLGFSGEPVPLNQGDKREAYTYINGAETLEVRLDGSIALYNTSNLNTPQKLPSTQESITIAQDWLTSHNLYPKDVTAVKTAPYLVIDEKPLATGVQFIVGIGSYTMNGLGVHVAITENGKVIDVRKNIPTVEKYTSISLKTADRALEILKSYLSSPDAVPPEAKECFVNLRIFSRLTVKDISIQYSIGGGYLQPVYVFEGEAYDQYNSTTETFIGMVDAVLR